MRQYSTDNRASPKWLCILIFGSLSSRSTLQQIVMAIHLLHTPVSAFFRCGFAIPTRFGGNIENMIRPRNWKKIAYDSREMIEKKNNFELCGSSCATGKELGIFLSAINSKYWYWRFFVRIHWNNLLKKNYFVPHKNLQYIFFIFSQPLQKQKSADKRIIRIFWTNQNAPSFSQPKAGKI